MIKNELTIKAFYKGKEVKIIQLQHLKFFFSGLATLSSKWKVEPFKKLWEDCEDDLKYHAMTIFIGLLYKDMCTKKGWEVNYKRFKNEMLLKNKYPKVFMLESDYLTIPDNKFDDAFRLLKSTNKIFPSASSFLKFIIASKIIRDSIDTLFFKYSLTMGGCFPLSHSNKILNSLSSQSFSISSLKRYLKL